MSTNVNACIYCGVVPGGYHTDICLLSGQVKAASPVQGAASASRGTCTQDGGKCGIGGYCFGCHQFPIAASASEAKGAAVKPWQERVDADFLAYWKRRGYNPAEAAMLSEIADWRALAERAQAQPSGAVADLAEAIRALKPENEPRMEMPCYWYHAGFSACRTAAAKLAVISELTAPAPEQEAAPKSAFLKHIENSSAAVEGMPAWKRNMWGEQEAAQVGMKADPVPAGIYYSKAHDNFYHMLTDQGQGGDFYGKWIDRRAEFPQSNAEFGFGPVAQEAEQPQGDAAVCEACGCASAKPGALPLCEPCRAEFKAWLARDAAANTNKGGDRG